MNDPTPPAVQTVMLAALLMGRESTAAYVGMSPASWDRLVNTGKAPAPLKVTSRPQWRRSDLEAWVKFGCPNRKTFEILVESER